MLDVRSWGAYLNSELATAGYGLIRNPYIHLQLMRDDDCRLFSTKPELIAFKGKDAGKWVLPSGCSTFTGDSGSAVINRATGEMVGVAVGGAEGVVSKSSDFKFTTENMGKAFDMGVSSFVPVAKISEALAKDAASGDIDQKYLELLKKITN